MWFLKESLNCGGQQYNEQSLHLNSYLLNTKKNTITYDVEKLGAGLWQESQKGFALKLNMN